MDISTLVLFTGAALLLLVTPGPAVLYVVARSIEGGRTAGVVSQLGLSTGLLVHAAVAAAGLSALLARSALVFGALKYAGAAYLVWLGIRRLREPRSRPAMDRREPRPLGRVFLEGVLVDVLNPKAALVFLAFMPQFVDPQRGAVAAQLAGLGLLFSALALVTGCGWALAAGSVRRVARGPSPLWERLAGWTYIGLGLAAAFGGEGSRRS